MRASTSNSLFLLSSCNFTIVCLGEGSSSYIVCSNHEYGFSKNLKGHSTVYSTHPHNSHTPFGEYHLAIWNWGSIESSPLNMDPQKHFPNAYARVLCSMSNSWKELETSWASVSRFVYKEIYKRLNVYKLLYKIMRLLPPFFPLMDGGVT